VYDTKNNPWFIILNVLLFGTLPLLYINLKLKNMDENSQSIKAAATPTILYPDKHAMDNANMATT